MLILRVCVPKWVGVDPTVPGFTQKATADGGGTEDNTVVLFYRRASIEPASYTVTLDATFGNDAAISMLRQNGVISSGDPSRCRSGGRRDQRVFKLRLAALITLCASAP
ncbi:hypothetical protein [Streptomyces sp. SYP-A7185]|uniref:hypothetical protein n=1 Tax=Streptomyces sp. SYP-A7185 TaxID=3040076 RepID=UPI0038F71BDB